MEGEGIFAVLALAFGLGMLHAMDADHIMAVTGLASTRPRPGAALHFCARWAVGHGITLLVIGAAVLGLGMAIPTTLSHLAERLVGAVLVAIGAWVLWDLLHRKVHGYFKAEDSSAPRLPRHVHPHRPPGRSGRGALLVGVLHGTAGSAPLLALLPVAAHGSLWLGLGYLLTFGLGVFTAMLAFGGIVSGVFARLRARGEVAVAWSRGGVALFTMGFGLWWLHGGAG